MKRLALCLLVLLVFLTVVPSVSALVGEETEGTVHVERDGKRLVIITTEAANYQGVMPYGLIICCARPDRRLQVWETHTNAVRGASCIISRGDNIRCVTCGSISDMRYLSVDRHIH